MSMYTYYIHESDKKYTVLPNTRNESIHKDLVLVAHPKHNWIRSVLYLL